MIEKKEINLYEKAKEAYYNGYPIMEDFEFDELERELGIENKSYIGAKHNAAYTIKHPLIMGSLSKVQIHKDNNGLINWNEYIEKVKKFVGNSDLIITPKYDGCSFEVIVGNNGVETVSSRGDGEYGKDLKAHLLNHLNNALGDERVCNIPNTKRVYRGEVLIDKNVFKDKYSEFVNPRSFVSGILNRDYDINDSEFLSMVNDLYVVIYDVREICNNVCVDLDWNDSNVKLNNNNIPTFYKEFCFCNENNSQELENIYGAFAEYRNICPFALDGIVFKPISSQRINNITETCPKDCVAVKFIPMLEETEIIDIEWNIGKTGEYIPTIITKPISMDGKIISRASGSNYGNLISKRLSIGTKVILSLAGDIIPFIYKVTDSSSFSDLCMNKPEHTYLEGCHLMAILSKYEQSKIDFLASVSVLNIDNLGNSIAENIFESFNKPHDETNDFFNDNDERELPNNILIVSPEDIYFAIVNSSKNKATGNATKISKAFKKSVSSITLAEIIHSCNFRFCGKTVSQQCANYLMGLNFDFSHFAFEGYNWVIDNNSEELQKVNSILKHLGKTFIDFIPSKTEIVEDDRIPIIMTGEPNNYKTKSEFLRYHPEYKETTSWKEVKIVFSNSLESNTGKMKKAKEKNIEIKLY